MPWIETSSGHFERPFDTLERMYRSISAAGLPMNREHFTISAVVRLRLGPSIGNATVALRQAWETLRYDFPHIAAYGRGDTYTYEVPTDDAGLESWLAATFIVEPATSSAMEVHTEAAPTELARMHYFPHTSEILFRSSHWRVDGIGTLHLVNHFLKVLAHPRAVQFGDEGKNLSVGLDEAAGISSETTPQMEKAATELVMQFVNNMPAIGLPARFDQIPCGSDRYGTKLSPQTTSAVIARCKAQGVSVTTAVHAGIVCATAEYPNPEGTKYTAWTACDLRRYMPPPYNGAAYATSLVHTGIPITATPSGFRETAAQLRETYTVNWTAPGPRHMLDFLPCYVEKAGAVLFRPPPPGELPPSTPALSSLGIIDDFLASRHGDAVEIADFWLGVDMLSPQLMMYAWTRDGELELSACYNKAFYGREFVEGFLGLVKGKLLEGLEIQN